MAIADRSWHIRGQRDSTAANDLVKGGLAHAL
jgi:hypothetical protein